MSNPLDSTIMGLVRNNPGVYNPNSLAASLKVRREEALRCINRLIARGKLTPAGSRQPLYVRESAPYSSHEAVGNAPTGSGDAA